MKKYSLFMFTGLLVFCVACKKEKGNSDGNGNTNNPPAVSYTLQITGSAGYFSSNPVNVTYDPNEASDVFYGAYQSQAQGTNIRARYTGADNIVDLYIHVGGGPGTGSKTIAMSAAVPQSDLILLSDNGAFALSITFPEQTPVSISAYGGVNGIIEGEISGTFNHKEIVASPSSTTEYTAPIAVKFKVKRSQ